MNAPWSAGSFTKNFRWGESPGLGRLKGAIENAFDGEMRIARRQKAWARLENNGYIPHIPCNFFLYNQMLNSEPFHPVDELVFASFSKRRPQDFDRLAFYTLILSDVGTWPRARRGQSRPTLWIRELIAQIGTKTENEFLRLTSADAIETFLRNHSFEGGTRKVATNLSYLAQRSSWWTSNNDSSLRWWADAAFLTLDRQAFRRPDGYISSSECEAILDETRFLELSGGRSQVRSAATSFLCQLYQDVGGINRLRPITDDRIYGNRTEPIVAVLARSPMAQKILPRSVWALIEDRFYISLRELDEVDDADDVTFSRDIAEATKRLRGLGIRSSITSQEILENRG